MTNLDMSTLGERTESIAAMKSVFEHEAVLYLKQRALDMQERGFAALPFPTALRSGTSLSSALSELAEAKLSMGDEEKWDMLVKIAVNTWPTAVWPQV